MVRSHHPRVRSLCLAILLDPAEADDAAQETFLKAFTSLDQYQRDLSFPAWLSRIASNRCLDLLRKRKRQKTDSLDQLIERRGDQATPLAACPDTDSPAMERERRLAAALRALTVLPADYRQILTLRELNGLSYEDIGAVMDCSLDSVKARLRRARERLQEEARHFLETPAFNQ